MGRDESTMKENMVRCNIFRVSYPVLTRINLDRAVVRLTRSRKLAAFDGMFWARSGDVRMTAATHHRAGRYRRQSVSSFIWTTGTTTGSSLVS